MKRVAPILVGLLLISPAFGEQLQIARDANTKIIGGSPSRPGFRTWQVALVMKADNNNHSSQFCGGTIVGEKEVLTAAHCLNGKTAEDIEVLSGTQSLKQGGMRARVVGILRHPAYNKANYDSDLAILKLENSPFGNSITIIAPADEFDLAPPNAAVTVVGWGNTVAEGKMYPTELLEVRVPLVPTQTCYERYKAENLIVTDNMLCAGYKTGGKDACQGDSGGGLIVESDNSKSRPIQIGVVSWGVGCASPENYGVYTRLSRFASWIKTNVPNRCTPDDVNSGLC